MADEDGQQLVDRLRDGDVEALGPYFELRQGHLLMYIQRKLGTALRAKIEPEDIFQEVCTSAVKALPTYKLGDRDPFGWLCQLVDRRIVDAHRRYFEAEKRAAAKEVAGNAQATSGRAALIDLMVASMTSPSMVFSRNQRVMRMLAALDDLPDEPKEALRLRYVLGLPSKEIAERMGKSDGSVRVMLSRALDKLQGIMGPDDAPRR
ncbi:MAG: sigma-70 family RNA polymerase sigma factor [Planctomycetota bacterium]|nr:sigma-70 family RNA polymerase sigma factor [Planctomycetota bacterium]